MKNKLLAAGIVLLGLWSNPSLAQGSDPTLYPSGTPSFRPALVGPTQAARTSATWTTQAALSTVRTEPGAVAYPDGRIYVWGGYNGSRTALSTAEVYSPAANAWSAIASLPLALFGPASAVGLDGNLYSFGGRNLSGSDYLGNCYRYSPTTNAWTAIAPLPVARWEAKALTAADGRIFVFGGWNATLSSAVGNEVQIYTPATNSWSSGAPLPTPLFGQGAALDAAGLMHLYGGISTSQSPSQVHEVYNPLTNTWATATILPTPARAYVAGTAGPDGNLYVMGGDDDIVISSYGTAYSQVDYYNPATATWASGPALPMVLTEAAAVSTGSYLYVVGGLNSANLYRLDVTAATATTWTGAVSTDWFTAGNWTAGVPTATFDALIPVVSTRYPLLASGTASARNLTLASGATLNQTGGMLALAGDLAANGTFAPTGGTVATTGAALQTLGGSSSLPLQSLSIGAAGATLGTSASVQRVLTLTGSLATAGQTFTLRSSVAAGDALVVNNGGVVTGNATVQRAIDPRLNPGLGYRHYSSPVGNTTVADLATTAAGGNFAPVLNQAYNTSATPAAETPFPTVFGYDQVRVVLANTSAPFDKGYFVPISTSSPLLPGRGYSVNLDGAQLVDFVGTLNTGDIPVTLARNAAGTTNYSASGYNFLGNPYPAPLDFSRVAAADRGATYPTLYVYYSTSQYGGAFRSYANGVGGNPIIPSGQGFFVRLNATGFSTFTFRNSQRLTTPDGTTFQRPGADTRPQVELALGTRGTPELDFFNLYFQAGSTAGTDDQYDAQKLPNQNGMSLHSLASDGEALAIDGRPVLTAETTIPLQVAVAAGGTYTLQATKLLNLDAVPVYLRDHQLGTLTDLHQQPTYQFTVATPAALAPARFELVFSPQQALAAAPVALAQQVAVYPNPAKAQVAIELPLSLNQQPVTAALVDVLGRVVRQQVLPAGLAAHALPLTHLAPGVYSLRLTTAQGTVVRKLVVE